MVQCLKSISLFFILFGFYFTSKGQTFYPDSIGDKVKYEMSISLPKAYVSGILIMARKDDDMINASLINEFGISLMDFSYNERKDKIKLHNILKQLNKWYIKRVLRSDLKQMLKSMRLGADNYFDKKHNIKYTFTLINDTQQ